MVSNSSSIIDIPISKRPPSWKSVLTRPDIRLKELKNYGCTEQDHTFSDYDICNKLSNIVAGKRVAIVGPAGHLSGMGMGEKIDSYDVVIRINHFPLETADNKHDYGSKTDILADGLNVHGWRRLDDNANHMKNIKYIVVPQAWDSPPEDINMWEERLNNFKIPNSRISCGYFYKICREVGTYLNTGFAAVVMMLNYDVKELYVTGMSFYNMGDNTDSQTYYSKNRSLNDPRHDIHHQLPQIEYFKKIIRYHYGKKLSLDKYLKEAFSEVIDNTETAGALMQEMNEKGYIVLKNVFTKEECQNYKNIIKRFFRENPNKTLFNNAHVPAAFSEEQLYELHSIFYNEKFTEPLQILSSKKLMFLHHSDIHYNFEAYSFHDDNQIRHLTSQPQNYSFIEADIERLGLPPYECYTIAIYMQDHHDGSGLTVIEGSHVNERSTDQDLDKLNSSKKKKDIISNTGDVVIIDARLYHRGNPAKDKDRAAIFVRMGNANIHGILHAKGAVQRQVRQSRKKYKLTNGLVKSLEENGINF